VLIAAIVLVLGAISTMLAALRPLRSSITTFGWSRSRGSDGTAGSAAGIGLNGSCGGRGVS
jgi:hypothetical protein